MPSAARAPVGVPRMVAVTALMLGAAVAAHAAAGGRLPSVEVLAVLGSLLAVVSAVVIGTGPRRRRSLLLTGAGQYAAHQVLAVTSHWSMTAIAPGAAHGPGHGHETGATLARRPVTGDVLLADGGAVVPGGDALVDGTMALVHLAATVAVGLVLATGDRAVAAARCVLRPWWRRTVPRLPVPVRPIPVLVVPPVVPSALVCVARRPRRGPPPLPGVARALTA